MTVSDVVIIDTNVAILLRDGDEETIRKLRTLGDAVAVSVITQIELENGASPPSPDHAGRRARLAQLLTAVAVLPFDGADADAYAAILSIAPYSKRKILDRMIAVQAIVRGATLATHNPADFRDVPGLKLFAW